MGCTRGQVNVAEVMVVLHLHAARVRPPDACFQGNYFVFASFYFGSGSGFWDGRVFCTFFGDASVSRVVHYCHGYLLFSTADT